MHLTFRAIVLAVLLTIAALQFVTSYCTVADYRRAAAARAEKAEEERRAERLRIILGNP